MDDMQEGRRLKKSISMGIAINILASALLKSVAIITAPVTTRILDNEAYGVLSIYNTWSALIGMVAGLSTQGSLTNFRVNSGEDAYHRYCFNCLSLSVLGHVCTFAFLFLFRQALGNLAGLPAFLMPLMAVSALAQYCVSFMGTYLMIENEAFHHALLGLAVTVFSFGSSLLFVYLGGFGCVTGSGLYLAFLFGSLVTNMSVGAICAIFFWKKGKGAFHGGYMRYCLSISVPLVFHSVAGTVLGSSDRIMLQKISGLAVAGTYSFTYNFACILTSAWYAANAVWTPFYFRYLKERDFSSMKEKKKNFDFLFVILSIGFVLVYPEFFRMLADRRYWGQMKIIPVLVVAFIANHLYSYPANYEAYCEKTTYTAIGSIGAAGLNILLNLLLIPVFGEWGAAGATAASYAALYVFHLIIAKKVIGGYPLSGFFGCRHVLALAGAFACCFVFYGIWYVRWIAAAAAGGYFVYRAVKRKAIL